MLGARAGAAPSGCVACAARQARPAGAGHTDAKHWVAPAAAVPDQAAAARCGMLLLLAAVLRPWRRAAAGGNGISVKSEERDAMPKVWCGGSVGYER